MPIPKVPLYLTGTLYLYHRVWWKIKSKEEKILNEWNRQNKCIFIHIPKTAGTTVFKALGITPIKDTHPPSISFYDYDRSAFLNYYKFTFVRNPWDRLASSFYFMQSGTDWKMQKDWANKNLKGMSFRDFVLKLKNPLFRSIILSERFFWPQSYWVKQTDKIAPIDSIFKFENINSELNRLSIRFNGEGLSSIPHERRVSRENYRSMYDNEMIEIVGGIYADDVEMFNYDF